MQIKVLLIIFLVLAPFFSSAHSGRTDSAGCHTCRTNCPSYGLSYGEYHCHTPKISPTYNSSYPTYSTDQTTKIKEYINKEKTNYYKNPHWFREKLIDKIVKELSASKLSAAFYVYTMLLDIK